MTPAWESPNVTMEAPVRTLQACPHCGSTLGWRQDLDGQHCACGWSGPTRPPGAQDKSERYARNPIGASAERLNGVGEEGEKMKAYELQEVKFTYYEFPADRLQLTQWPERSPYHVTAYGKTINKLSDEMDANGKRKAVPHHFRLERIVVKPVPYKGASIYQGAVNKVLRDGIERQLGIRVTPKHIGPLMETE
jgi:hypothetical protein